MTCPKCGAPMVFVPIPQSPYPLGHFKCSSCGLEVSKK